MASKSKTKKKISPKPKAKAKAKAVKAKKKVTASKPKAAKKAPAKKLAKKPVKKTVSKKSVSKKPIKKILKKTAPKIVNKPVKKAVKEAPKQKQIIKKAEVPVVQKVKKCKKSLCKEPAVVNGYCRYHYVAGWKVENIDKKVKKLKHLDKLVMEIRKRFPHEYMELIKADLVSDKVFRQVLKDMDLEEDINNFEISDDTQKIIESYSSLVELEREE